VRVLFGAINNTWVSLSQRFPSTLAETLLTEAVAPAGNSSTNTNTDTGTDTDTDTDTDTEADSESIPAERANLTKAKPSAFSQRVTHKVCPFVKCNYHDLIILRDLLGPQRQTMATAMEKITARSLKFPMVVR